MSQDVEWGTVGEWVSAAWLRRRIEARASATEIGDETGYSARHVRDALHRHGIPLPRQQRLADVDWSMRP